MAKKTDTKKTAPDQEIADVIVIGAGMAGLTLAALLGKAGLRVTVIDREHPDTLATEAFDSRTVALSMGTRAILEPLKIWQGLEGAAQAITTIDVQEGHDPFVLNFEVQEKNEEAKQGEGAFGWILPNTRVRKTLYETAKKYGVRFVQGALRDMTLTPEYITAVLMNGETHSADLVVGADGRASRVRDIIGVDTVNLNYKQTAWVGLITHDKPHHGLALERFYPEGPFAALPFTDDKGLHRSAIVWTRHAPKKLPVPALEDISAMIAPLLDDRYGTATATGPWAAYPLGLTHAKQFVSKRVALISDAAHAMHPIAGQGLNVGMRDVKVLSELLVEAKAEGNDPGSWDVLESYQSARRFDVMTMMAATDLLNRLFANDKRPVRALRSLGLGLVNRLPPLKRFFTGVATGKHKG